MIELTCASDALRTDQQPQHRVEHKEQHQHDHRGEQRLQYFFHDGIGKHHGIICQHSVDAALARRHDGGAEAFGQKARVLLCNAGKVHHAVCRKVGGDLGTEAPGQQIFEHPARTGGRKLPCAQQADKVAKQLHDAGKKALAGVACHQHQPDYRT